MSAAKRAGERGGANGAAADDDEAAGAAVEGGAGAEALALSCGVAQAALGLQGSLVLWATQRVMVAAMDEVGGRRRAARGTHAGGGARSCDAKPRAPHNCND